MESVEARNVQIELPEDLLDFDFSRLEEDHEPSPEDIAGQLVPKINRFLEQFNLEDKKKAVELIESQMYQQGWGDPEKTLLIIRELFKALFLSKLQN